MGIVSIFMGGIKKCYNAQFCRTADVYHVSSSEGVDWECRHSFKSFPSSSRDITKQNDTPL